MSSIDVIAKVTDLRKNSDKEYLMGLGKGNLDYGIRHWLQSLSGIACRSRIFDPEIRNKYLKDVEGHWTETNLHMRKANISDVRNGLEFLDYFLSIYGQTQRA